MAKALDTFQCKKAVANAHRLVADGYTAIGLYYFHSSAFKELLTRDVAKALNAAGLWVWSVWEDGRPTSADYFSGGKGTIDGARAAVCARNAGQPKGTPVYFAADYDVSTGDLPRVTAYAKAYRAELVKAGYTSGVYGNGLICRHLKDEGLVSKTWLSESTGFQGYHDWKPHADIVQAIGGTVQGMDIDADETAPSGGGGWKVSD